MKKSLLIGACMSLLAAISIPTMAEVTVDGLIPAVYVQDVTMGPMLHIVQVSNDEATIIDKTAKSGVCENRYSTTMASPGKAIHDKIAIRLRPERDTQAVALLDMRKYRSNL